MCFYSGIAGVVYFHESCKYFCLLYRNIIPAENRFVATCTLGEGWHNYHHAFPFDYKAAEHFDVLNFATYFIRFFEKIGWAYDLREASSDIINSMAKRLGDGTPVHFPLPEEKTNERATG